MTDGTLLGFGGVCQLGVFFRELLEVLGTGLGLWSRHREPQDRECTSSNNESFRNLPHLRFSCFESTYEHSPVEANANRLGGMFESGGQREDALRT